MDPRLSGIFHLDVANGAPPIKQYIDLFAEFCNESSSIPKDLGPLLKQTRSALRPQVSKDSRLPRLHFEFSDYGCLLVAREDPTLRTLNLKLIALDGLEAVPALGDASKPMKFSRRPLSQKKNSSRYHFGDFIRVKILTFKLRMYELFKKCKHYFLIQFLPFF